MIESITPELGAFIILSLVIGAILYLDCDHSPAPQSCSTSTFELDGIKYWTLKGECVGVEKDGVFKIIPLP